MNQLTDFKLVDWSKILPSSATVMYSSLEDPDVERDALNRDVAAIRMESGIFVDVEWNDEHGMYVVTAFTEEYEKPIEQLRCKRVNEVIEEVKRLSEA